MSLSKSKIREKNVKSRELSTTAATIHIPAITDFQDKPSARQDGSRNSSGHLHDREDQCSSDRSRSPYNVS